MTAQLSKVVERLLKQLYDPYLSSITAFGPSQFAYTLGRGARDALAFLALTWIKALGTGRKVAVYCSDVSGAFDRVRKERLIAKLEKKGVHPKIVAVLASWLQERLAQVVVGGTSSKSMILKNMVFQGTVNGPTLWNLFFEDARQAINECSPNMLPSIGVLTWCKELPLVTLCRRPPLSFILIPFPYPFSLSLILTPNPDP